MVTFFLGVGCSLFLVSGRVFGMDSWQKIHLKSFEENNPNVQQKTASPKKQIESSFLKRMMDFHGVPSCLISSSRGMWWSQFVIWESYLPPSKPTATGNKVLTRELWTTICSLIRIVLEPVFMVRVSLMGVSQIPMIFQASPATLSIV